MFASVQLVSSLLRIISESLTSRRKFAYFSTPGMPKVLPCMIQAKHSCSLLVVFAPQVQASSVLAESTRGMSPVCFLEERVAITSCIALARFVRRLQMRLNCRATTLGQASTPASVYACQWRSCLAAGRDDQLVVADRNISAADDYKVCAAFSSTESCLAASGDDQLSHSAQTYL